MPYNRMYNELLPPENESMSDLTRTLIGIQMRREEKARQAKLDALAEERQRQMMQMAQDEQSLKLAEIQQRATAATPEAQLPTVPKTTSEGAFVNPEEAAYAGDEAPPSGFVKTGEMTSDVPDVSPLTVNLSGERSVRIPQQSLESTRSQESADFMSKLPQLIAAGIASGRTMSSPETEPYGVVPANVGAAQERVPTIPGFRDVTVNGKRALLTNEQIAARQAAGDTVLDYDKPPATAAGALDEEDAASIADGWAEGRAFPSTQAATTKALRYMDEHPEKYPNKPRKLGFAQQQDVTRATDTLATISDVRNAYEKVKSKVGPITYTFNEYMRKTPGIASDPDFITFNTLLRGMGNLEIKRITGAQMSEQEASRLLKGMATGGMKPGDFEAALAVMERNATRNRDVTLYGKVLATPTPPPGAGRSVGGFTIEKVQ